MKKSIIRMLESPATQEENSYRYRVEWEDRFPSVKELIYNNFEMKHYGPGSRNFGLDSYDDAWTAFTRLRDDPDYKGVRLIRIDADGSEILWRK